MASTNDKAVLESIFNPLMPLGECLFEDDMSDEDLDAEPRTEEVVRSQKLELEGVKAAEMGDLAKALALFTEAVTVAPRRASAFNNRAQAHRLNGDTTAAFVDLNNALNLSCGKGKAAAQAYCQRACLHIREGKQQQAKLDFENAAKLGSKYAKAQLVQMNPYAAMCNKMLKDLMKGLEEESSSNQ